jgi:predicted TIM-barrel fold metal-dependent hydrolase
VIIDFHTHVFSPRVKADRSEYLERDTCFAALYSSPKARLATAEDLIESMDRAGIEISVILNFGWTTQELCVETNDYILESVARYPRRLVGFCTVVPRSGEAAVIELERCISGRAQGIGEMRPDEQIPGGGEFEILEPLIKLVRKHRLIMLVHASEPVGHHYQGKGSATPGVLYPLIKSYPEITLVCAHWGGGLPFYELMPEVKEDFKNVYYDSAASPLLYRPEVYNSVIKLVGEERILFGSDYPLLTQRRLLDEVESLELPSEARQRFLSGNALRLLESVKD